MIFRGSGWFAEAKTIIKIWLYFYLAYAKFLLFIIVLLLR